MLPTTRGPCSKRFPWNVTGHRFHWLHEMFEKQYLELASAIDEIAERIRALGFHAPGSFAQFSRRASIRESNGAFSEDEMLGTLLSDHELIACHTSELLKTAEKTGDQATVDLMAERMAAQQKAAWMLRSSLE